MTDIVTIICGRVRDDSTVVAGATVGSCMACRHPVWLSPSTLAHVAGRADVEIYCMVCKLPPAGEEVVIPEGQVAELDELMGAGRGEAAVAEVMGIGGWIRKLVDP